MKVLIATPLYPPDIGGPATYAKMLNDEFPKRGVSVVVISYGDVRHLPKGIAHIAYAVKLFRALGDAEILFALDPVSVGLPAALVAFLRGKNFVVRIAGDYAWEQGRQRFGVMEHLDEFIRKPSSDFSMLVRVLRRVQTFVARRALHVIVPSKYFRGVLLSWGIPAEKITVVYNAFEEPPRLPARVELRKSFGFSGAALLSAGRLVPWKGFTTLISIIPEIRKHHPDCTLYIAGSGPLAHALKSQIAKLNLDTVVHMLGDVPHLKLMEYKHAADCFVLNTGYEGFSHHILEALAIGVPVVTTNVGGNPELVENGVTGTLVSYNDKDMLVQAIEEVLNHRERWEKIVENGKKFAASFTVIRMAEETLPVFNRISTKG